MDIELFYDKIFRYCYYRIGDKTTAEDLTQETFLRFLNSDSRMPERYLYTIAKNLCIDEYRKTRPMPTDEAGSEADEIPGPDETESMVDRMTILNAMEQMPEEEREVLILRYVNDESVSDICVLTGLSRFAVYRRCKEATNRMKELLGKENYEG
ncbi:MAG: RNA polymerase sigma factor [Lachnospiraceae bacterium]|nr:RNA polymerase sigma factor [Lachnospiraceae bacterium]